MKELRHPLTGAVYGIDPETHLVRVEESGRAGLYTHEGIWRSGDVFDVDPEMCQWVGGPQPDVVYGKSFKSV